MIKNSSPIRLETKDLSIGYKTTDKTLKYVQSHLNLEIRSDELICLLGPNGAGKSTLMRSISGVQKILKGSIYLDNTNITKLNSLQIAKKISLVLTEKTEVGNLSVYELISLGRYPYTNWLGQLSPKDREIIDWAMELTETSPFYQRHIYQLSDGERQKVMIARALAQDTPLILLDEPTAHLDLINRAMIFRLLRKLAKETRKAVLMSSHELELALLTADKIWLMHPKNILKIGTPEDLVLQGFFEDTFQKAGFRFDKNSGSFQMNEKEINSEKQVQFCLKGNPLMLFWTKRALEREGFIVVSNSENSIEMTATKQGYQWKVFINQQEKVYYWVGELLDNLKSDT